jgi:hypothetical protein
MPVGRLANGKRPYGLFRTRLAIPGYHLYPKPRPPAKKAGG